VNEAQRGKQCQLCTPSIADKKEWATSGNDDGADEVDQIPGDVQPRSAGSRRRGKVQNSVTRYCCPDFEGPWLRNQRRSVVVDGIRVQSGRTCFEPWYMI
jgi:hypothetical protein